MARPFYEIQEPYGATPVTLRDMKDALRLPSAKHADDDFVCALLDASTQDVERYLGGREVRPNSWVLYLDGFDDRLCLTKTPVDTVTAVERLVSDVWTPVTATDYYVKPSTQFAEVLLVGGASWPEDADTREHSVRVSFTTKAHPGVETARAAIKRHVTYLYENRGDFDPEGDLDALKASGAQSILARLRIQKV